MEAGRKKMLPESIWKNRSTREPKPSFGYSIIRGRKLFPSPSMMT
jgi:hypothetical protein